MSGSVSLLHYFLTGKTSGFYFIIRFNSSSVILSKRFYPVTSVRRLLIVGNDWIFSSFYVTLVVTSPDSFPCRQKKVSHCRLVHLLECTGDALR